MENLPVLVNGPPRWLGWLAGRRAWLLVPAGLIVAYLAINVGLPRIPQSWMGAYVRPMWSSRHCGAASPFWSTEYPSTAPLSAG